MSEMGAPPWQADELDQSLFFEPTPGPGDSDGGDIYPPEGMSGVRSHAFRFGGVAASLEPGGYEVVYETDRLQVGVYVLAAPEPDRQQPHEWDELYFVLKGSGTLATEGVELPLDEGAAAFVPAGAEHRFSGYERLVLLVVFDKS
jgi:mannose-6-phosphate isomerase-like protein (cupin superfamily)